MFFHFLTVAWHASFLINHASLDWSTTFEHNDHMVVSGFLYIYLYIMMCISFTFDNFCNILVAFNEVLNLQRRDKRNRDKWSFHWIINATKLLSYDILMLKMVYEDSSSLIQRYLP